MNKTAKVLMVLGAVAGLAACAPQDGADPAAIAAGAAPLPAFGLIGATPATLDAAFGQPALRRVDGTAQVWLYHSPVCALNLILYPDPSGTPRVAAAVPDDNDPARCAASLAHPAIAAALEPPATS
jgi:hypothetical protein